MAFISPGELSAAHSAIEAPAGASTNCAACHIAAASNADEQRLTDSDGCLTCHFTDSTPARAQAFFAHSLDPDRLADVTQRIAAASDGGSSNGSLFASLAGAPPQTAGGQIACAVCHGEHQGRSHDLSKLADASCQVCHEAQFDSFANGHPEFRPLARTRAGIAFDHAKHQQTYFGTAGFDCVRCHIDDDAGRTMLLRPYEQACAGCHTQGQSDHHGLQIKGQAAMLLQLPEIDFDADIYWPEDAAIGERMPPLVRLLLAGDDEALTALQSLYDDEDADWYPLDWEPDDEEQVTQLAAALTRLVALLRAVDHEALRQRLAKALGAEPTSPAIGALADQLASIRLAALNYQRHYAPGLIDASSEEEPDDESLELETSTPAGLAGWYLDHGDVAVMYRPTTHGDALFKSLIDALVAPDGPPETGGANVVPIGSGKAHHPSAVINELLVVEASDPNTDASSTATPGAAPLEAESGSANIVPVGPGEAHNQIAAIYELLVVGNSDTDASGMVPLGEAGEDLNDAPAADSEPQQDVSGLRRKLRAQIFDELLTAKGGGSLYAACMRCHNLDRRGNSYNVNWRAAGRETNATGFARYSHRPHLVMLRNPNNCATCHKFADQSSAPDPAKLARGFLPHTKNQCTTCHAPPGSASGGGGADQGCLQCHDYHIQRP